MKLCILSVMPTYIMLELHCFNQKYTISQDLFNMYMEAAMKEALRRCAGFEI